MSETLLLPSPPPEASRSRRGRTPQEEAEWLEDKRAEYEADRICGHHWGNC
jgi:hypothetical protein